MIELLRAYSRIRSTDIEEVRAVVSEVHGSHRLDPYPRGVDGLSVFNSVHLGDITFSYSRHGVPVRVWGPPADSFVLVRFSLSGSLIVHGGRGDMHFDRGLAAVFDPDVAYNMSKSAGAGALVLRVERAAVHAELCRILGRPPARRLRFASSLDMSTPPARSWFSILSAMCADLEGPRGVSHPLLQQPLQRLVIAQLLTTLFHSATDELARRESATPDNVEPRVIRRADQIISERCHEPLTVVDVAEAVGVSVRSLQKGFRRYLDTTPIERLRQARLAGAHAALLKSDPTMVTVSRIATDWGFRHHGRFSRIYRETFDETPAQTLQR